MRKRCRNVNYDKKHNESDIARNYILKIGSAFLKPEDYIALQKNNVWASCGLRRYGWKEDIGYEPDAEYFQEISFFRDGAFYRETFVRILVSYDEDDNTIYEYIRWYPDGNLKEMPERTITFRHISSLSPEQVRAYFTSPKLLSQWLSDGYAECEFNAEKNIMIVSIPISCYFTWYYIENSDHLLEIEQIWLERYKSRISIQFDDLGHGTEIMITLKGMISLELEEEYRDEWEEGMKSIP